MSFKKIGLLCVIVTFTATVFAENLKTGTYTSPSVPKTILRLQHGGNLQVSPSESPMSVLGKGRYTISGDRLTITFGQINNSFTGNAGRDYSQISGRTFIYTIKGDDSFNGNGETWVRTGN